MTLRKTGSRRYRWRARIRARTPRCTLSDDLAAFLSTAPRPGTLARLRDSLGRRGLAAFLFLLGTLAMVPLPPGGSIVFGVPVIIVSVQMILQRQVLWLPRRLLERPLSERHLDILEQKILPLLQRAEGYVRPRYWFLPEGSAQALTGLLCIMLAILLMLPIPFGNFPAALGIALLALALLQRDGLLLLIALAGIAAWLLVLSAMTAGIIAFAREALSRAGGRP